MARDVAVVSGYLVRCPLGGYAWQVLHYVLGLEALGFETYFHESTEYYSDCFEPRTGNMTDDPAAGLEFISRFMAAHGLADRWVFEDTWRNRSFGLASEARRALFEGARLWITLAAVNRPPAQRRNREGTVFIDIDPGYTQVRAAAGDAALLELLREHRTHFTVGEHIGSASCAVPTGGFAWKATRPPVLLSLWTPVPARREAPYTTIGKWDEARREVEVNGERFSWRKRSEWMKFLELPERAGESFLLAMDAAKSPADLARLRARGWTVVDPIEMSVDPDNYRDFIRDSKGEFTVAKDLNVRLRTGWFSDRAACYLAAARPVINQDTGFDDLFPVGKGLFGYRDLEEAVGAFAAVRADYDAHCAAARRLAEEYFDASRVLRELIAQV